MSYEPILVRLYEPFRKLSLTYNIPGGIWNPLISGFSDKENHLRDHLAVKMSITFFSDSCVMVVNIDWTQ